MCLLALSLPAPAQSDYNQPWRPQYHFTPPRNFMNDPNGMVYYKGEYHLFYQFNPQGNVWGHMSWGHAISDDMLHWQHLPVAIPEATGRYMIYSGSAAVDWDNTGGFCVSQSPGDNSCLIAIYTAAAKSSDGTEHQSQYLAYSNDRGRHWTDYSHNPIIDLGKPDFRDPKVFWYAPQKKWVLVAVLADQRRLEIFDSHDLKHWKHLSEFGPAGDTVGQWECPDLFELPVEGTSEKKWVLIVNRNPGAPAGGTGTRYIVGNFDGQKFTADSDAQLWADYGKDFYATQRFSDLPDHRTIWIGWIGNWQYANKEPTQLWRGAQSLPRELSLRRVAGKLRLVQAPIAEAKRLRSTPLISVSNLTLAEVNHRLKTMGLSGDTLEIELEFSPAITRDTGIRLRKNGREETLVGFSGTKSVFFDRTHSGEVSFSPDFPVRHTTPLPDSSRAKLHIFLDRSSVETFVNDGELILTDRIYPSPASLGLDLFGSPKTKVLSLTIWRLSSVWK